MNVVLEFFCDRDPFLGVTDPVLDSPTFRLSTGSRAKKYVLLMNVSVLKYTLHIPGRRSVAVNRGVVVWWQYLVGTALPLDG